MSKNATLKKTATTPQEDELSAFIDIRKGQGTALHEDTTGKIDRVALEVAAKTARKVQRIEHRAVRRPPFLAILIVLAVAGAVGYLLAQAGWF